MDLRLGSRNTYVRMLEQRLRALDLYSGAIDGVFGGGVESGVKQFQAAHNLQCDGIVGPETWSALFSNAPQPECTLIQRPLAERCLALTGAFETTAAFPECFAGLACDFDGEGISFGVLQWNIGEGTLQPLFTQMLQQHSQVMARIFQNNLAEFTEMLDLPRDKQVAWWAALQTPDKAQLFEPWKGYLLALGATSPFQQIQMDHSAKIYDDALALAHEYGLTSERAVALMFDICVQNGGIEFRSKEEILEHFAAIPETEAPTNKEITKMETIANRVAESSRPEFIEDVRNRKLTIANGTGTVHGLYYDLIAQYGVGLVSFAGDKAPASTSKSESYIG